MANPTSTLVVRELTQLDEAAFKKAIEQTPSDPNFAHYYDKGITFDQYLYILNSVKLGYELPLGHVPAAVMYAFVGGDIVGRLTLRFDLNEEMINTAGHIGVIVIPDQRKKGYATEIMKQGLSIAKRADMPRILLTCSDSAEVPRKLIEKCGGTLENTYMDPVEKALKRRYWVSF
ncbi:MAG: GNAT family N-acetyltransferase [Xanthomonadaceae bacterium]|nr:GNAT family N-acetyltransferase [Xanthomonadaceae bacterium]